MNDTQIVLGSLPPPTLWGPFHEEVVEDGGTQDASLHASAAEVMAWTQRGGRRRGLGKEDDDEEEEKGQDGGRRRRPVGEGPRLVGERRKEREARREARRPVCVPCAFIQLVFSR